MIIQKTVATKDLAGVRHIQRVDHAGRRETRQMGEYDKPAQMPKTGAI
jgi:hypothetical protein